MFIAGVIPRLFKEGDTDKMNSYVLNLLTHPMAWDLSSFLQNAKTQFQTWGGYFLAVLGIIMIIVGLYQLGSGLMSDRKQVEWVKVIALLLIGGVLAVSGVNVITNIADGGSATIKDLGGTILLFLR